MIGGIPDKQFVLRFMGFSLVTANIIYRLPDHPNLVQEFIWQELDLVPKYPELSKFLDFWKRELDGPIEMVKVAHVGLLTPAEFCMVKGGFRIH